MNIRTSLVIGLFGFWYSSVNAGDFNVLWKYNTKYTVIDASAVAIQDDGMLITTIGNEIHGINNKERRAWRLVLGKKIDEKPLMLC